METSTQPHSATGLPGPLYYQLVYTLADLLPPPLDGSPQALRARNHAAIAKVAALLPAGANELDLAAQCVAARAQAEDVLRLLRQNADDIGLVMRLNAQYALMARTSISMQGCLMRVQAVRHKREATEGAADADAWAAHVAEQSMLMVADPDAERQQAAQPEAPAEALAACASQSDKGNVPGDATKSQDVAFETGMIAQPQALGVARPDGARLHRAVREAVAQGDAPGTNDPGTNDPRTNDPARGAAA